MLFFHTNYAVVRPAHAYICLIGSTSRQNPLVGRGYVCVGSDYRSNLPIEVPTHRHFLGSGLCVEVDKDHFGGDGAQKSVRGAKRVFLAGHEDAALQVNDGIGLAGGELALEHAVARRTGYVVGWPDN